jgi:hypothetical protein
MKWTECLAIVANFAQILSVAPLVILAIGAIGRWRAERILAGIIGPLREAPRGWIDVTPQNERAVRIGIERGLLVSTSFGGFLKVRLRHFADDINPD